MRASPRAKRTDRLAWTTTRRGRATSAVLAITVGFSGAAVVDAFLLSPPAVAELTDFGPDGDGLTRYVVASDGARVTDPASSA